MANGRFLSKTVSTDQPLNSLTWQAQACYMMAVPHLDRDGLITGHPLLLMAQVAPLRAPELVAIMPTIVQSWIDADLVVRYAQADGQQVLHFPGFQKHQKLTGSYNREAPSQFDPPPGYQRTETGLIPADQPMAADQPVAAVDTTHDLLATNSGVTHDLLATNSGVTHPLKQEAVSNKSEDPKKSSSSSPRPRARPGPAAVAAPPLGEIKPEILKLLTDYGVAEPARSEIARDGVTAVDVQGWIDYIATQSLKHPVGYLVQRLRAHQPPPDVPAGSDDDDPDSYEALYRRYVPAGYKMVAGAIVPDDAP